MDLQVKVPFHRYIVRIMDFLPLSSKFTHFCLLCEKGCVSFIYLCPASSRQLSSLCGSVLWALAALSPTMTPVSSTHEDWMAGYGGGGSWCSSWVLLPSLRPRSLMQEGSWVNHSAHIFGCRLSGITFFRGLMLDILGVTLVVLGGKVNPAPCYSVLASCRRMPFPTFFI